MSLRRTCLWFSLGYFVAAILWNSVWLGSDRIRLVASDSLSARAWGSLIAIFLIPTGGALVLAGLLTARYRSVFQHLFPVRGKMVGVVVLEAAAFAYVAALTGLWPWAWDVAGSAAAQLATQLVANGLYGQIGYYFLASALSIPVLEEFVFRYGLTNYLYRKSGSSFFAITMSSVVFGVLHVGNAAELTVGAIQPFLGATMLGAITSYVTLKDGGSIGRAIIWHAMRNLIETVVLFYSAYKALS